MLKPTLVRLGSVESLKAPSPSPLRLKAKRPVWVRSSSVDSATNDGSAKSPAWSRISLVVNALLVLTVIALLTAAGRKESVEDWRPVVPSVTANSILATPISPSPPPPWRVGGGGRLQRLSGAAARRPIGILNLEQLLLLYAEEVKRPHLDGMDNSALSIPNDDGGRKHVAILVSGSFRRFFLRSTAANLVKPMVRQGHTVELFAFLMTGEHTPWKSDVRPYLKHLTWDPAFGPPSQEKPSDERIRSTIIGAVHSAGGTVRYLELRNTVLLDDDEQLRNLRSEAQRQFPKEDPDSRFPTRSLGRTATVADANRNMLRLFRALEWTFDAMVPPSQCQITHRPAC